MLLNTTYLLASTFVCLGSIPLLQAQSIAHSLPDTAIAAPASVPLRASLVGSVLDELNNPLAGVTIKLVGGKISDVCITNSAGRFLLDVPSSGGTVLVTFQGYHNQEISFSQLKEIHVVLLPLPGFKRERKARVIYRRHNKTVSKYPNK